MISAPIAPIVRYADHSLTPVARVLFRAAVVVAAWEARHRTRKALTRLDAHLLRDIGLTTDQQEAEAIKPFWQD